MDPHFWTRPDLLTIFVATPQSAKCNAFASALSYHPVMAGSSIHELDYWRHNTYIYKEDKIVTPHAASQESILLSWLFLLVYSLPSSRQTIFVVCLPAHLGLKPPFTVLIFVGGKERTTPLLSVT